MGTGGADGGSGRQVRRMTGKHLAVCLSVPLVTQCSTAQRLPCRQPWSCCARAVAYGCCWLGRRRAVFGRAGGGIAGLGSSTALRSG